MTGWRRNTLFDNDKIADIRDRVQEPGIGDAVISGHCMTAVHVEILGQFLDLIQMDDDELIDFFDCYIDVVCSELDGGVHA